MNVDIENTERYATPTGGSGGILIQWGVVT